VLSAQSDASGHRWRDILDIRPARGLPKLAADFANFSSRHT
jgi:hypothetical protein